MTGKRVRVFWPVDSQWYIADVRRYDENTGEHLLQYPDGDTEWVRIGEDHTTNAQYNREHHNRGGGTAQTTTATLLPPPDVGARGGNADLVVAVDGGGDRGEIATTKYRWAECRASPTA